MSILGKYINEEEEQETSNYRIPAVFRGNQKDMSLTKSIMVSTAIHPLAVFLVWLFIFIAGLLGISFVIFNKPEAKPKDIEFVLVDKENTPINKNTRFKVYSKAEDIVLPSGNIIEGEYKEKGTLRIKD